jgi:hypothetical protein
MGGSTTTLNKHINKACPQRSLIAPPAPSGASSLASFFYHKSGPSSTIRTTQTQTDVIDEALRFFISGNIPFNQAENPHFKKLISSIKVNGKSASPPSRKVVRARLKEAAAVAKDELKTELAANDSKVSLALDCWTSRPGHSYLGM